MSGTIRIIECDGAGRDIHWPKKSSPDYQTIKSALGQQCERVRIDYNGRVRDMYICEEGFVNPLASEYYGAEVVGPAAVWIPDGRVRK